MYKKLFIWAWILNFLFGIALVGEVILSVGLVTAIAMSFDMPSTSGYEAFLQLLLIALLVTYPLIYLLSLSFSVFFTRKNRSYKAFIWSTIPGIHLFLLLLAGLLFFD